MDLHECTNATNETEREVGPHSFHSSPAATILAREKHEQGSILTPLHSALSVISQYSFPDTGELSGEDSDSIASRCPPNQSNLRADRSADGTPTGERIGVNPGLLMLQPAMDELFMEGTGVGVSPGRKGQDDRPPRLMYTEQEKRCVAPEQFS